MKICKVDGVQVCIKINNLTFLIKRNLANHLFLNLILILIFFFIEVTLVSFWLSKGPIALIILGEKCDRIFCTLTKVKFYTMLLGIQTW